MFWSIAIRRDIVRRAFKAALLVGMILIAINQGDVLIAFEIDGSNLAKMVLTFMVPYCVSTYSSVRAVQDYEEDRSES
ncbi:MAG: nitrate/nitrite transporter NrtS [Gammaproteobacteria bacterium]|nr:nitrate/nitrite transporter NrtS [Gammaproteobacteria bacterium]